MTMLSSRRPPRMFRLWAVALAVAAPLAFMAVVMAALGIDRLPKAQAAGESVQFSAAGFSVNEADGSALITVTISPTPTDPLTISLVSLNGSASNLSDYAAISNTFTVNPGEPNLTFTVGLTNDALYEGSETLTLSITEVISGNIGTPGTATLTITDDETQPTAAFSAASYSVGEADGSAAITATLSGASAFTITVNAATSDNAASSAADYAAVNTTLTLTPGFTQTTFSVTITNDIVYEGNEALTVTLSGPTNSTLGAPSAAALTITDNETQPTVQLSAGSYSMNEGAGSQTITATLSGASAFPASVTISSTDDTASGASDYTPLNQTLNFAPGATLTTTTVAIANDSLYENTETFTVTLSSPSNASPGAPSSASVQIADNDPLPVIQLSAITQTVSEGAGTVTVTASLNTASGVAASVPYTVSGTATGGGTDHNLANGSFSVPTGSLSDDVTFTLNNDALDEDDETVIVTLGAPANATLGAATVQTVTIQDNDPLPDLSINDVAVTEGDAGTVNAVFTVSLSAVSGRTVSVNYGTANGTAMAGSDFAAATGALNFPAGTTTQQITVTVNGDTTFEANEAFAVNLSGATSANITDGQGIGTINNDDAAPTLAINDVTVTEADTNTSAVFTVTLTGATEVTATVNYSAASNTASLGTDFSLTAGALTFGPGDNTETITVTVVGDDLYELAETYTVTLSGPANAQFGDSTGLGTINNDDDAPSLTINDVTVTEGNAGATNAVFTALLTGATELQATVAYTTANGTATTPADYLSASGTLTFPVGVTAQTITITVNGDALDEDDETFTVGLSSPGNATISDASGLGTISDDDPLPNLTINNATVTEGDAGTVSAVFTVTLSPVSGRNVTVNYATANITATAPADYVSASGTLTFTPGAATRTITVTVNSDLLDEDDETFSVNLSGETNAAFSGGAGLGTITDNDPTPSVSIGSVLVTEGDASAVNAVFNVTLSAVSGRIVTVNYATTDNTAASPADYVAASGTLTFTPGVTTRPITITVQGDLLDELDETFLTILSAPVNASLGSSVGVGTIADNDPTPSLAINNATVAEGDAGTANAVFTVTLSAASGRTVTVNYATANITATAPADYASASGTLTFDPGVVAQAITVTVNGDVLDEDDETFNVNLSGASNATITDASGSGTITDDDPTPTLSINDVTLTEGDAGTASAVFTVTLSAVSGRNVSVNYATANVTASAPADYASASGALTFAPGSTTRTITVTVNGDLLDEDDETFNVNLSGATNANLSDSSGLGTITDNDPLPNLSINNATVTEGDAGTASAVFTVTLSAASGRTVTVNYATADLTASAPADYLTASGALTFTSGTTTQTITVTVNGDTLDEDDETFNVNLSGASNANLSDSSGLGTITDNDPLPNLSINNVTVTEGDAGAASAVFTVTLSAASGRNVSVNYATANITATAPADYLSASGTLTFTPGVTTQTITVTVNGDTLDEFDETFNVNLSGATNAAIADGSGLATITDNDPTPSLAISDVTVTEGDAGTTNAVFTVTLSAASGRNVTVNYATANVTATAPADYVSASGTLTFDPGVVAQAITVTVNGDVLDEDDETFNVNLSGASNATIADSQGLGTITDDDPIPSLAINDVTITEGDAGTASAVFTVTLSAASGRNVTVNYATANITATAPADYVSASGTLTFTPGSTTRTITVTINGDTLDEVDETFSVTLSGASNAAIADSQGVGTITDNDPTPSLAINDATVTEGDAGTVSAVFTVTLSAASGRVVTVGYATADITATAPADYLATSGALTFTPGVTTQTITVTVNSDTLDEDNETFNVTLSGASNANLSDGSGLGTITDNDPTPSLAINDVTVTEGDAGTASAVFTVTLSAASGRNVSVNYATANITATAPADYVSASGTLTFTPGTTTQTITVTVNGDTLDEFDETFTVTLSGASNAAIADSQGVGTITDNDPTPSLVINDVTVTEGDAGTVNAVFTVTLSAASGRNVTVNYATANITATAPADYVSASGTLTFTPGVTIQTITIAIQGDTLDEIDETFSVNLNSEINATIADGQGVGTITDNDPTPTLSINDVTVTEGDAGTASAVFTVTLSAASGRNVTVNYATADITATAPADYVSASGTLTFTPGTTIQTITVTVQGDTLDEIDETFSVTLSGATNAAIADSQGVGTITDNDPTPSLVITDVTVTEGDAGTVSAVFTVTLSAASGRNVTVNYATANITATAPTDYVSASGTLTFTPGSTMQTITVTVQGDTLDEDNETFSVTLSGATNAAIADSQGVGTITDDDLTPSLTINDVTVTEGDAGTASAVFTVTLSTISGRNVAVNYATADITATAPADYLATSGVLTFTPGVTTQTITVTVNGDTLDEFDETFSVTLSGASNAVIADGSGLAAITDDDATPSLSIADASIAEGDSGTTTMQFTLNLSAPSGRAVAVTYATADITATAGVDYDAANGTTTFAPGMTSQDITVTVRGDALDEINETFALNLSGPVNAALPDTQAIGTIVDDDPTPSLSIASAGLTETNSAASLIFTATLSAPSGLTVTVSYATADGTAFAPADYVAASGVLTFTPGLTTRTITVTVQGDTLDELTETFVVNLSNAVNANLIASQATGTIVDEDPTPTVQFAPPAQTFGENAGTASVTATLSAASGLTVTAPFTVSGTATGGGVDHTLADGTITINPLTLSGIVTFTVINDALDESNEVVVLTLGAPTNAALGAAAVHTATLTDDDPQPSVSLTSSNYSVNEDSGPAIITATLNAPSGLTATANYTSSNGTASAGSDYTAVNGVITFTPGLTLTTFTVPITADTTFENNETFSVTLGAPANATLGSPVAATATIVNDDPQPTVQFESTLYSVSEDSGGATPSPSTASITATLSNPSVFTVTVNYSTTAGTATSGVDYLDTSGTLTFTPGVTTQAFTITTQPDDTNEPGGDETVLLALSNPTGNATLGSPAAATLGIIDNDGTPTVRFGVGSLNWNEGSGPAPLAINLSNPSNVTVTVNVRTTNGTATAGLDYTAISQTVTFLPGETSVAVNVPITDDTIYESNETFTATLSNPGPPGALVLAPSNTSALVTIVNNEAQPAIQFSAAAFSGAELGGTAVFTVTLNRPSAFNTRVTYATSNGTALSASDYAAQSAQITFAPGVTTLTVTIPITSDATYEGNETFNLALSGPVNGALGTPSTATVTITDNDSPPTIQFSAATYSRLESAGPVVVTATLSGSTAVTASVNYATSNGTAIAPGDFTAQSGALTFPPGASTRTITITLANDSVYEGNEAFTVTLSSPVSATLGAITASRVTILENDAAPTLRFSTAGESVSEGAPITVSVVLSGSTAVPASVNYATTNGTATAGSDYAARSGTLIFNPGTSLLTFTVPVTGDLLYELEETFSVALSAPVSATLTTPSTATYTIPNGNPPPVVQLSTPAFVVGENVGSAVITATLAPVSAVTATVDYATSNITATAGSDYTAVTGTITFTPGLTATMFSVPIINDPSYEGNELLNLALSSPSGATLSPTASTATLNIANDDPQAGCVIYNSTNVPLAIPDAITTTLPGVVTSTLTIPNPGHVITDISVRIENIQHTYVSDLQITIIGPGGQSVRLFNRIGDDGDNLLYTVFNDSGAPLLNVTAPFTGRFRPEGVGSGQLATFDNQISPGIWKLEVVDLVKADTGTLNAWGLEICGPARPDFMVFLPLVRR